MRICVQCEDFDISAEINLLKNDRTDLGAITTFSGLVRDIHGTKAVKKMTLEHFPGMALKELNKIGEQACERWPLEGLTIIHRYGELYPGDNIVLVITASHHRDAAFKAAQFIMDWLKVDAPFWKKEQTQEGDHWVETKGEDDENKNRWE